MYEYKCKVNKVIDGDTVDVDIDLGFGFVLVVFLAANLTGMVKKIKSLKDPRTNI